MKPSFYSVIAKIFLFLGIFFVIMEILYGYGYHVWNKVFLKITVPNIPNLHIAKLGETILFAYLGITCLLISIASGLISSKSEKG